MSTNATNLGGDAVPLCAAAVYGVGALWRMPQSPVVVLAFLGLFETQLYPGTV